MTYVANTYQGITYHFRVASKVLQLTTFLQNKKHHFYFGEKHDDIRTTPTLSPTKRMQTFPDKRFAASISS